MIEYGSFTGDKDEEEAEKLGGRDDNDYTSPDTVASCDKGGHQARSIGNDNRDKNGHLEHFNKEKNK